MQYTWMGPGKFVDGPHIQGICNSLQAATEAFEQGTSTNLMIAVPMRHGKSVITERYFPAWFLGRCALFQPSVLLSGYGAALVQDASTDCKRVIESERYTRIFPNTLIDGIGASTNWRITGSSGRVVAAGLGGALAGRGFNLGILDDYCKNRSEAESKIYRDHTWTSFTNDFLTRRMVPSIMIIVATPWHVDDIRGRIISARLHDPNFPHFEDIVYPARNADGSFLWEAFLGRKWYQAHYATLTPYEAAGLLDCEPNIKSGGIFDATRFKQCESGSVDPAHVKYAVRAWDKAASLEKGDYTAGVLLLRMKDNRLVVYDVVRAQLDTDARERKMREQAEADKQLFPMVRNVIEVEPGSGGVDSLKLSVKNLEGFVVDGDRPTGSKQSRALPWSSQVNAGQVELVNAVWNTAYMEEHGSFPAGHHDDMVDASSSAFSALLRHGNTGSGGVFRPGNQY